MARAGAAINSTMYKSVLLHSSDSEPSLHLFRHAIVVSTCEVFVVNDDALLLSEDVRWELLDEGVLLWFVRLFAAAAAYGWLFTGRDAFECF